MPVKEHPILFKVEMVRAILEGRKTQTRRIMVPQPSNEWSPSPEICEIHDLTLGERGLEKPLGMGFCNWLGDEGYVSKHGIPGDRLWVKETFLILPCEKKSEDPNAEPCLDCQNCRDGRLFAADNPNKPARLKWKPSIFMPRWASRITLEIMKVRVERVQDISREDAIAEGIFLNERDWWDCGNGLRGEASPETAYRALWCTINGEESWRANPWVWVIEFKKI